MKSVVMKGSSIQSQSRRDFRDPLVQIFFLEMKALMPQKSEDVTQSHIICQFFIKQLAF
jgi:hypothetical protein